ncbi:MULTISPECIES: LytTR family DNA-binding domain-containing protein [Lacrimispora]|uniref:LytR/AlgR family response regulator transcription factor n=1 Tax=Lacrimispora TaxID=2719231 RepID=UPI000BE24B64|nr:LytTR family DNA-binding domain-containing protein [Lacrimispora amygdalina]MDK2968354.1 two-component system, LytTR family, response regulator LytT [Lacrimispora sp.]
MQLNLAFCDDDKAFLSNITPKIENIFRRLKVEVKSYTFEKGDDLIAAFSKYQPYYDVIFLDIDMPQKDGKEIARQLRILDKKFKLVFVTAYTREVLNTFQYDVIGFLPKTLLETRLPQVIKQIIDRINEDNPRMQIFKVNKSVYDEGFMEIKVPLDDIMYFECINRQVYLFTKRETFILHHCQFSGIVKKFIPLSFVDIHRTCIVNIKYIFSIDETEIRLDNGIRLPLSRRKRQNIFDKFSELVAGDDIV